jgi:hypothetical protein
VQIKFLKNLDIVLVLVVIVTLIISIFYLQTVYKWWYEDDPSLYASVLTINNPVDIFLNPDIIRTFGSGASVTPMQILSYWIDVHLFGVSPLAAYLHTLASMILIVALLYLIFLRITADRFGSACISLLWLCLPSTIAVYYFLSTRHYLEGFGWSLLSCWIMLCLCSKNEPEASHIKFVIMNVCVLAAMFSKEIYVTTLPTLIFCYSVAKRRYWISISQIILILVYVVFRFWVIGGGNKYPLPLLDGMNYLQYLTKLPYTLTANTGGYVFFCGMVIGSLWLMFTRPSDVKNVLIIHILLIIAALISLYPTAEAVLNTFQVPGTWYRAIFIINSLIILTMGYLLVNYTSRRTQVACLVIMLVFLIPGVHKTRSLWNDRFSQSEQEAKFYLSNPDKLMLSEEAAYWYLPGIDKLYRISHPHFISNCDWRNDHAKQMLAQFPTIWRLEGGRAISDQTLYWFVKAHNM